MLSLFWRFFDRRDFLKFSRVFFLTFLSASWELITAFVIMLFAQILTNPSVFSGWCKKFSFLNLAPYGLYCVSFLFVTAYVLKGLFNFLEIRSQSRFVECFAHKMRLKILDIYTKMTYTHYTSLNTSHFSTSLTTDISEGFQRGIASASRIMSDSFLIFVLLFFCLFLRPKMFIVLLSVSAVMALGVKLFLFPRIYEGGKDAMQAKTNLYQNVMQFIQNFKDIRIFQRESIWKNNIRETSSIESHAENQHRILSSIPRIFLETVFAVLLSCSMIFVQDISVLGVYIYVGFRLLPSANRIINELNTLKHLSGRLERFCHEMMHTPQEYLKFYQDFSFEKSIVLRDVCFGHKDHPTLLSHVSFSIEKGECIGFIGKSGSGKSTLIDLILGLLTPQEGHICIDEHFSPQCVQWRDYIGYVSQSVSLIDHTLAYNVALGEPDMEKVERVLGYAQFCVDQLPNGLETRIGERGIRLSGGERQRVAIARALYKDPQILIFDEATSALDYQTESLLMETIYGMKNHYTLLMIAHRHDTLKQCQKIYKVEKGRVELCM